MNKKNVLIAVLSFLMILTGLSSCSSDDGIAVTGISLDKSTLSLLKREIANLKVKISPENASNQDVTWNSSDKSVALIEDNGNVIAIGPGKATISVVSNDGNFMASCLVTVNVDVSSIHLSVDSITINKGETKSLIATVLPDDASDKNIIWSSSDTNIAVVDDNGSITAINGGSAYIKATSADSKVTAECHITVIVPVESVSLDKTEIKLIRGEKTNISAIVYPSDATTKDIIWSSSNENVVIVDNGTITALKAGGATITATTVDGNKIASCNVFVDKSENIGYDPYGEGQQW